MKIEKNVPIPEINKKTGKTGRPNKYPFDALDLQESFLVECKHSSGKSASISSAANQYVKTNAPQKKFTKRKVEGGYRVWRIK